MLSGFSLRSAFVVSINSLILSGFPLTFIHLAEPNLIPRATLKKLKASFSPSSYSEKMRMVQGWAEASLSAFLRLYILVCAVVQKYHHMIFIYNYSQF